MAQVCSHKGRASIQQDRFVCSTLEHVGCHITQRARQCWAGLHHAWLYVHSLSLTELDHRLTGTSDPTRALHQVHTAVHTHSMQGIHNIMTKSILARLVVKLESEMHETLH